MSFTGGSKGDPFEQVTVVAAGAKDQLIEGKSDNI